MIKELAAQQQVEIPRATWEAPTISEYDAKAEIQGVGVGTNEPGSFNS